jgi:hypothetical protein
MTNIKAVLWSFVFALVCTTDVLGQTPNPEPGIWTGTVVIRRTYLYLGHVQSSIFSVSGYVGAPLTDAESFYGIITNLDNRDKADEQIPKHVVSIGLHLLEENGASNAGLAETSLNGTILPQTLRFTKDATTQKMRSISYRSRKTDMLAFVSGDVVLEATVTLTWRKPLPSVP